MLNVYEQVDRNKRKSMIVIVLFILFVVFVSWVFTNAFDYGPGAIGIALIFAGLMSFSSYWWGDKIILAISKARPASKKQDFQFFTVTENLTMAAQVPMPKLYVIEDSAPNAFATGRDPEHAVVCATSGLLAKLTRTELEGVVGHELSHVRNFDIRLMSIVAILVGMITLLADWLLMSSFGRSRSRKSSGNAAGVLFAVGLLLALLSPIIARLIQLAVSRRQEFLADAGAVMLTRYPQGLAKALEKISASREPLEVANKATAHLYIANPLKNRHDQIGWFANLFNTHPPASARIKALKEMG